jgi:hypothetical protein
LFDPQLFFADFWGDDVMSTTTLSFTIRRCSLGLLIGVALSIGPYSAGTSRAEPNQPQFTPVGWQSPESLPHRFRNHCGTDFWAGRYCEDHCGLGYQFFYCSEHSFGCCHVGVGYCDWGGSLRCAPTL